MKINLEDFDIERVGPRLFLLIMLCWALLGFIAYHQEDSGKFGDMFGMANSLFSGLAFAGIILTIMLQHNELRLQRLELTLNRKEMEGQKEQLALQAMTLKGQAADANFFRMLEMFRHMAQSMRHPGGVPQEDEGKVPRLFSKATLLDGDENGWIVGVEYWRLLARVCLYEMNDADIRLIEGRWADIYRRWDKSLSPYFATLTELLISISEAEESQGRRWSKILRAQLGMQEMLPIFFYGLSPVGQKYLKSHIENFGIFAHFSSDMEFRKISPSHCYEAGAWKM